jgi:hypothetical protein
LHRFCRANRAIPDGLRRTIGSSSTPFSTGAPWRDLPERFGNWNSVFRRFRRWAEKGVWERVLQAISEDEQYDLLLVDSSIIRAHQHAAGGKKGPPEKRWDDHEEALVQRFMQQLTNVATLSK